MGGTVAAGAAVPYDFLISLAPNSRISLPSPGNIQISDTGYYQISFGVYGSTTTSFTFQVSINGVLDPATKATSRVNFGQGMMTGLIRITQNPSTVSIININAATFTAANSSVVYPAFLAIIKLAPL